MLRFRLGPFPIAIEPWFWISAVLLSGMTTDLARLAIWVAVVFVSVLVHELGHAIVARRLGGSPEIILRAFGGVTLPILKKRPTALQEIALSVAGPLFGLSLWLVAFALERGLRPAPGSPLSIAAGLLAYTSFWWAVLNLLPVLDLDGGHVLQAALTGVRKKDSRRLASGISAVIAAAVAVYAFFIRHDSFLAIFFVLFLVQNVTRYRSERPHPEASPEDPLQPAADELADVARFTEVARNAMAAGDPASALAAADLLESSDGPFRQGAGLRVRAGVLLAQGALVDAGLVAGRSFTAWPSADAAVVAARANLRSGDRQAAVSWLRRAAESGAPVQAIRADAELSTLLATPDPAT